jgi:hypothetical protein
MFPFGFYFFEFAIHLVFTFVFMGGFIFLYLAARIIFDVFHIKHPPFAVSYCSSELRRGAIASLRGDIKKDASNAADVWCDGLELGCGGGGGCRLAPPTCFISPGLHVADVECGTE